MDEPHRLAPLLPKIEVIAVPDIPMIQLGDDLPAIIFERAQAVCLAFEDHDVVVVTQKVVSKAEGHSVRLSQVEPSPEAVEVAALVRKDPRFVEVVLRESRGIMAMRPDLLVVENNLASSAPMPALTALTLSKVMT
jgi:coenzyme F420-0:L-glutamate ligase/coenzyme F420-1:gamma-L-glutamate ligase